MEYDISTETRDARELVVMLIEFLSPNVFGNKPFIFTTSDGYLIGKRVVAELGLLTYLAAYDVAFSRLCNYKVETDMELTLADLSDFASAHRGLFGWRRSRNEVSNIFYFSDEKAACLFRVFYGS